MDIATEISTDIAPPASAPANAEVAAFLAAARGVPPDRLTACAGWTAHDLLAHVVAGGVEMLRLVGARLAGEPVPPTAAFAEREPAARALDHETLLALLEGGDLLGQLDRLGDGATVSFTGWAMDASALRLHIRSELAIHRWDLVGSDDESAALLGAPELTEHAVRALSSFEVIAERISARAARSPRRPTTFRLRSDGRADVVVGVDGDRCSIRLASPADGPSLTIDPAGRLLMLWGRRPPLDRHPAVVDANSDDLATMERWLYA